MTSPVMIPSKILRMDGTPEPEPDRIAALEARVLALEIFMGMAPVHPDVPLPPEKPSRKRKETDRRPTEPDSLGMARVIGRKDSTPWTEDEIKRFVKLRPLEMDDLELLARFYDVERAKGTDANGKHLGFHRHSLETLLNNYPGELDKARNWAKRNPARAKPAEMPPAPPGYAEFIAAEHPGEEDRPFLRMCFRNSIASKKP